MSRAENQDDQGRTVAKRGPVIRRVDANQHALVKALRAAGASVSLTHTIGQGYPDLSVGWHGKNLLLEVKSEGGKLTPEELDWQAQWRGQVATVHTVEEALSLLS